MIWVGNDIVQVDRIRKLIEDHGDRAIRHLFTSDEVRYCESKPAPSMHYAGRFAGKEAVKKAFMAYDKKLIIPMNRINIVHTDDGPPEVRLPSLIDSDYRLSLSISHTDDLATAVAVLEVV